MTQPEIPAVGLVKGFRVDCTDGKCGTIGFEKKRDDAQKIADRHRQIHLDHAEQVAKYAAEIQEASDTKPVQSNLKLECPSCRAVIGMAHAPQCDVARCLENGGQRILRDHMIMNGGIEENHDCGHDKWTGFYPGEKEAGAYGVPLMVLKELGEWDAATCEWVLLDGWEKTMHERGLGPAISGV